MLIVISGFMTISCKKDKSDVKVNEIVLNKNTITIKAGESTSLSVSIQPSDANNKDLTWTSSDPTVALVANGVITAIKIGEAKITVTSVDGNKTASCTITVIQAGNQVTLKDSIVGIRNLSADSVYLIKGFLYVVNGGTLNIPAGTVIKGEKVSKGSLIVERGGKLNANGTKANPIVFTSAQPAGARTYGDWGGIVLCGKAPVNQTDPQVEGGPRSHYGGTDAHDNSGILTYVRIEFPGIPFAPDKEINGLTFCGVGDGTTIDYIQVSYSGDDSYEWFGGTVNCKHLVAIRGTDDEYDTDFGYSGKVQFALGIRDKRKADYSGSNGFESDNDAISSTNAPFTSVVFSNCTFIGPLDSITTSIDGNFARAIHIRRNSKLKAFNSVFAGWPTGLLIDGAGTWAQAQTTDGMQVKNCILVAMKTKYYDGASGPSANDVRTWFWNASRHNDTIANNTKAGIRQVFFGTDELTTPAAHFVLPKSASPVLTGADFTDANLNNDFFDKTVQFRGAFGSDDWTDGWCNWTPQVTVY